MNKIRGDFLVLPLKKFFWVSFFSGGIYNLYWFYRNWKNIKIAERSKLNPVWRTIFIIFFIYSLFRRIFRTAKKAGYQSLCCIAGLLSTVFILVTFLMVIGQYNSWDEVAAYWVLDIISIAVLLPAQKALNFSGQAAHPELVIDRELTTIEKWFFGVGVVFFCLAVLGQFIMICEQMS